MGASSGHITNLKQTILETFSIYGDNLEVAWAEFSTLSSAVYV